MEGYIGEIRMFAGTFAPRSWAFCQGQLLSIAQNTALFSILGTTYGGNGQTTFGLPDFRGRVAVGTGQGPGLPSVQLGEMAGAPTHTLLSTEVPAHTHSFAQPASQADATTGKPSGKIPAVTAAASYSAAAPDVQLGGGNTSATGGNQPHNNMQPYLGMNYIICLQGIFPSRN